MTNGLTSTRQTRSHKMARKHTAGKHMKHHGAKHGAM